MTENGLLYYHAIIIITIITHYRECPNTTNHQIFFRRRKPSHHDILSLAFQDSIFTSSRLHLTGKPSSLLVLPLGNEFLESVRNLIVSRVLFLLPQSL